MPTITASRTATQNAASTCNGTRQGSRLADVDVAMDSSNAGRDHRERSAASVRADPADGDSECGGTVPAVALCDIARSVNPLPDDGDYSQRSRWSIMPAR